jgi:hypothetical protein
MMRRIVLFTFLLAFGNGAMAGERSIELQRVSCTLVRFYVAKYSEAAAESWARGRGAIDKQIDTARPCLYGSKMRAATWDGR